MWRLGASLVAVACWMSIVPILPCPAGSAEEADGPQDALHQVVPGDDLHLLAGYYYGDARQWERIWQANHDQVSNPNRIRRGALLHIPDATPPEEPYAHFVARTRRAQPLAPSPAKPEEAPGTSVGPRPPALQPPVTTAPGRAEAPAGSAQPPPVRKP